VPTKRRMGLDRPASLSSPSLRLKSRCRERRRSQRPPCRTGEGRWQDVLDGPLGCSSSPAAARSTTHRPS
jgi:hypothetical protein